MNSRGKYLLKNTGILTISSFASKILIFLLVPLYTSILSKEDFLYKNEDEIKKFQTIIENNAHLIIELSQNGGIDNASSF